MCSQAQPRHEQIQCVREVRGCTGDATKHAQFPLLSYRPNMLGKTRLAAGMEEKNVVTVTATTNARTGITIRAIPVLEVENRIESRTCKLRMR